MWFGCLGSWTENEVDSNMTVTCPAVVKGNDDEGSSLGDKGDWCMSCPETVASDFVDSVPITAGDGTAP